MKLACLQAGQLMQRRAQGLSASEGLRLEEHLGRCHHCRSEAGLIGELAQLHTATFTPLSIPTRKRAIERAFDGAPHARRTRAPGAHAPALALLSAAAVVALTTTLALRHRPAATPHEHAALATRPEPGDRVLSGHLDLAGETRGAGQTLSARTNLQSRQGALVALAHAKVELRARTSAHWEGQQRTLTLQHGSVMVEVDPARHESFTVETEAFTVQVLGTRFEVTQTGVHVLRGRVSVQPKAASDGAAPLILEAGSARTTYQVEPANAQRPEPAQAEPTPAQAEEVTAAPERPAQTTRALQVDGPGGAALLERARAQLAEHQLSQARHTLRRALPRLDSAALRAEALSLEAECHLLAKHYGVARDTYLRVARRFSPLPAAETALFAAARIEAEHGTPSKAEALFARYLARYPSGSYVREAEHRKQALRKRAGADQEPAP